MSFTMRAIGAIGALALAAPSAAPAQQPALQFDRGCYTEDQDMTLTGAGYTPGGQVDLVLVNGEVPRAGYTGYADATGAITGSVSVDAATLLLNKDEGRQKIVAVALDKTRVDAGQQPPESQYGISQFTFTEWTSFSSDRYVPGKRATVEIYGWAFASGQVAWLLFQKGSRTVKSVKVGRLDDECGDRTARIRVPRDLKPGSYRTVLTIDRKLRDRYMWLKARVTARRPARAAAASATSPMHRAGDDQAGNGKLVTLLHLP